MLFYAELRLWSLPSESDYMVSSFRGWFDESQELEIRDGSGEAGSVIK